MDTKWEEGYRGFQADLSNPYKAHSRDAIRWAMGYHYARKEVKK